MSIHSPLVPFCSFTHIFDSARRYTITFPNHRGSYVRAMTPYIKCGERLFLANEVGHPQILARELPDMISPPSNLWSVGSVDSEVEDAGRQCFAPRFDQARFSNTITIPAIEASDMEGRQS